MSSNKIHATKSVVIDTVLGVIKVLRTVYSSPEMIFSCLSLTDRFEGWEHQALFTFTYCIHRLFVADE